MTPIINIQRRVRGWLTRLKRLPMIMYKFQHHLATAAFQFSAKTDDGRINSCMDEDTVINILTEKFGDRMKKPKIRMWYDFLGFDSVYGWIPINIKTTTTTTSDNTGNLAMCVYAYTDEILDIHRDKSYENGKMSDVLFDKLKTRNYNTNHKKDYYFIVLNKTNAHDVIINSVKGLSVLTPNINNLPFQVNWSKNRDFAYAPIHIKIQAFIECMQRPNPSWKETFMANIRSLEI